MAAEANLTHGMPLKNKELKEAFRAYVSTRQHRKGQRFRSYREIASDLGGVKAHTTVRNWMKKMFPSVFRAMGGWEEEDEDTDPDLSTTKQCTAFGLAMDALDQLRAAACGVGDPEERGDVIATTTEVLEEIKQGGPSRVRPPSDF
jgi:hypothetical protein